MTETNAQIEAREKFAAILEGSGFSIPKALADGLEEPAVKFNYDELGAAYAGPALTLAVNNDEDNEALEPGEIDTAIAAKLAEYGLTRNSPGVTEAISGITARTRGELNNALNALSDKLGEVSQSINDKTGDVADAVASLERREQERRNMYNDWFNGDQETVDRMAALDRIAIYSDDPEAVAAANEEAEEIIRENASSPEEAETHINERLELNNNERREALDLTAEQRSVAAAHPELSVSESVATAQEQASAMDQALLAQVRSSRLNQTGVTTDNDPEPEAAALAARPVAVASGPSFNGLG